MVGDTPLFLAFQSGHLEIVQLLLAKGSLSYPIFLFSVGYF